MQQILTLNIWYKFLKAYNVIAWTSFPPMGLHFLAWDTVRYLIISRMGRMSLKSQPICLILRLILSHHEIHSHNVSLMRFMSITWDCWHSHAFSEWYGYNEYTRDKQSLRYVPSLIQDSDEMCGYQDKWWQTIKSMLIMSTSRQDTGTATIPQAVLLDTWEINIQNYLESPVN